MGGGWDRASKYPAPSAWTVQGHWYWAANRNLRGLVCRISHWTLKWLKSGNPMIGCFPVQGISQRSMMMELLTHSRRLQDHLYVKCNKMPPMGEGYPPFTEEKLPCKDTVPLLKYIQGHWPSLLSLLIKENYSCSLFGRVSFPRWITICPVAPRALIL